MNQTLAGTVLYVGVIFVAALVALVLSIASQPWP
jgi:hypothetical protein